MLKGCGDLVTRAINKVAVVISTYRRYRPS